MGPAMILLYTVTMGGSRNTENGEWGSWPRVTAEGEVDMHMPMLSCRESGATERSIDRGVQTEQIEGEVMKQGTKIMNPAGGMGLGERRTLIFHALSLETAWRAVCNGTCM